MTDHLFGSWRGSIISLHQRRLYNLAFSAVLYNGILLAFRLLIMRAFTAGGIQTQLRLFKVCFCSAEMSHSINFSCEHHHVMAR